MAGTNDFKAVATGGGGNVLTQAEYAALTTFLANGFSSGIVPSDQFNKVIRQSSVISEIIGQIIADINLNALDDGDATTLKINFLSSLGSRPGHTYTTNDWTWIDRKGGLMLQWGSGVVENLGTITIPTTFSSTFFGVVASEKLGNYGVAHITAIPASLSSFSIYGTNISGGYPGSFNFTYIAVGV